MKRGPAEALALLFAVALFGLLKTSYDYILRHLPKDDLRTQYNDNPPKDFDPEKARRMIELFKHCQSSDASATDPICKLMKH